MTDQIVEPAKGASPEQTKKPYATPVVRRLGTVRELTQTHPCRLTK